VADGLLITGELTMLIGPAEALPAQAVAPTATNMAAVTLDLIVLCMSISLLPFEIGRTWLTTAHSWAAPMKRFLAFSYAPYPTNKAFLRPHNRMVRIVWRQCV
jgi:hypothetical protein